MVLESMDIPSLFLFYKSNLFCNNEGIEKEIVLYFSTKKKIKCFSFVEVFYYAIDAYFNHYTSCKFLVLVIVHLYYHMCANTLFFETLINYN
jgi:hypothetical protein